MATHVLFQPFGGYQRPCRVCGRPVKDAGDDFGGPGPLPPLCPECARAQFEVFQRDMERREAETDYKRRTKAVEVALWVLGSVLGVLSFILCKAYAAGQDFAWADFNWPWYWKLPVGVAGLLFDLVFLNWMALDRHPGKPVPKPGPSTGPTDLSDVFGCLFQLLEALPGLIYVVPLWLFLFAVGPVMFLWGVVGFFRWAFA